MRLLTQNRDNVTCIKTIQWQLAWNGGWITRRSTDLPRSTALKVFMAILNKKHSKVVTYRDWNSYRIVWKHCNSLGFDRNVNGRCAYTLEKSRVDWCCLLVDRVKWGDNGSFEDSTLCTDDAISNPNWYLRTWKWSRYTNNGPISITDDWHAWYTGHSASAQR